MATHMTGRQSGLRELLEQLVSIDSVNPDLDPGGAGEAELARFVGGWLEERGVEVGYQDLGPERQNVIGRVKGLSSGRSVLLNAHLDTVPAGSMPDPFRPVVRDGRLYGRGAQDMKSGLAVAMAVTAAAAGMGLAGDVVFAGVADEEAGSRGTEALLTQWRADCAIVLEPTGHVIAPVHKGFAWFDIETSGVAAHGSDPSSGVDAIFAMGAILRELDVLSAELLARQPIAHVGTPSLHASVIEGGGGPSTYPESCRLLVERRTVPGETPEAVAAEIEAAVSTARGRSHGGAAATDRVSVRLLREPLATPPEAFVVRALERASSLVLGTAEVGAVAFWTDAALMAAAGVPSVVFGPRGKGLHSIEESVELESVHEVADVLSAALEDLCGPAARSGHA